MTHDTWWYVASAGVYARSTREKFKKHFALFDLFSSAPVHTKANMFILSFFSLDLAMSVGSLPILISSCRLKSKQKHEHSFFFFFFKKKPKNHGIKECNARKLVVRKTVHWMKTKNKYSNELIPYKWNK